MMMPMSSLRNRAGRREGPRTAANMTTMIGGTPRKKSTNTERGHERVRKGEIRAQPTVKPITALNGRMIPRYRRVRTIPSRNDGK